MKPEILFDALDFLDNSYLSEAEQYTKEKRMHNKKSYKAVLSLAATVTLLLAFGITAFAFGWFGLDYRMIPAENPMAVTPSPVSEAEDTSDTIGGWIAQNGASDSVEAVASLEWERITVKAMERESVATADELYAWWDSLGDYSGIARAYSCTDQKMLDELIALSEKYCLQLHNEIRYPCMEGLYFEPFINGAENECLPKALYEDGSFSAEGSIFIVNDTVVFSINKSLAGKLAPYGMYIHDADGYEEWQMNIGEHVLNLALSNTNNRGLLLMQENDCFVTITFTAVRGGTLSREDMEQLAELFDYDLICKKELNLISPKMQDREEAEAQDRLFTIDDYMETPEYLAGSSFQVAYVDWYNTANNADANDKNKAYYGPIPTGNDVLDQKLTEIQEQYGLVMPTASKAMWYGNWVDPIGIVNETTYNHSGNAYKLGAASQAECWELFGVDNFYIGDNATILFAVCWDNGVWQCWGSSNNGGGIVTYVPKGSFCPVLQEWLKFDTDSYAYNTACGEQVYIGNGMALYEIDNAYVIVGGNANNLEIDEAENANNMQVSCDSIDFTRFK